MLLWRLAQSELVEDAGHMPFDGRDCDHEFFGHAGVGTAFGDQ